MMGQDIEFNQVYNKIQELLKNGKNNISVLEEKVDVELQMEYFRISKRLYKDLDKEAVLVDKDDLLDKDVSIERKKELLSSLAKIDNPEAFRIIEAYKKNPDEELVQWSKLAYQESKMVLETSLLGEAPIFISTGLGGKGSKLRYFIVLVANEGVVLKDWQVELVKKELDFAFTKDDGVVEDVETHSDLLMITALLPIEKNIKNTLSMVVKECNELGNFLMDSFIVTNVKNLELDEIRNMVALSKSKNNKEDMVGGDNNELKDIL
ncbi:hypothetical protein JCM21142_93716 [Saccharicrinis fermentans DSM 9555 = JCM 21142]|uniref:Uncharacterized protein n=2 Tax=Saccharicrinis fermentans TaxID=982 RepID=W7YBH8_9BACT|nr:hypothetical protein JCM21142_93716 [Saccharicrinis fermentans DSM 9555 = JCM 21142]